ncbi:MAG: fibronectin type III domain-containing protein [Prevotellaceae bacterium]|nr:fibronectin type III domain-containing protein [Prevotellaceae bacterium]
MFSQNGLEKQIADSLTVIANSYSDIGKVTGVTIQANKSDKTLTVFAPAKLSYIPLREENVARIYKAIKRITASKYDGYAIKCITDEKAIEELIPNYFRTKNPDSSRKFTLSDSDFPLIKNISKPYTITKGLQNRHLALWHSHGWYYKQQTARWEWQRARLNQTVEDIFTISYTLPYIVPMLENAGATVFMPRDRDTQLAEIIVDNDDKSSNSKYKDHRRWRKSKDGEGFACRKTEFLFGENPFRAGTYMHTHTVTDNDDAAIAEWIPTIEQAGEYAVYISYKSLKNSATDALYTVFHAGGATHFKINQRMGGGTWIYLGTFYFDNSKHRDNQGITLSSVSSDSGKTITADAVKFGGGMGNIARKPSSDSLVYEPITSGKPRWAEGARYWLQWAGVPDSVYSRTNNTNDYTDDFTSRGFWVNWLAGGSQVLPQNAGLNIPIDLAVALHSDAGTTLNDSIIGTLGIFSVANTQKSLLYKNGVSRWAARDLADIVQNQVVADIRKQIAPEWTCRNLWNKSYSESREPEVPTLLLELLSHQNFADMRYGLDPRFQFIASRAIYKGILRYLSNVYACDYIVQPLPVNSVSCCFINDKDLEIKWQPTLDSIEPTATPEKFIVYMKIDDGGFDNGTMVNANTFIINNLEKNRIYSFKITAVNGGGESFPSEILSACSTKDSKGTVLIVNAFDRICAPASFDSPNGQAGFIADKDAGVPYLYSMNYTGNQFNFDRQSNFIDNDSPGFGASYALHEAQIIAGNTFEYPFVHGKAIAKAGFSFVSCSKNAVVRGAIALHNYKIVDIILGKQKKTLIGNGKKTAEFETFSPAFQTIIKNYLQKNGNLLISGAYIGTDLVKNGTPTDKRFFENTLKCKLQSDHASLSGKAEIVQSPVKQFARSSFEFYSQPNPYSYFVESPDALAPAEGAYTIARYADGKFSAATAYADSSNKICTFGFPLETIKEEKDRNIIFRQILNFFK